MDKDDLFNVQESLQSPEEKLKKQNDKKKMKVEVYISEGAYEQLRGYQKLKQQNIQTNFIIPTPLKQANVNRYLELVQQSINNGHKLHNSKLNKESIDSLIQQFRESEKQKHIQKNSETLIQPQDDNLQLRSKQMIFRSMKDYQPKSESQFQSDIFTKDGFYDRIIQNRITQIFNF
ncbi:unnamed protein product (macronuclear) [Paramecium tetraurelia]|uniref:Uncharacterized protein n=1 Tax=Paramecium tetraurelia TaxID=5888 RepID=A0CSW4_PARTE|nr:uncharacterized protein GSPATT00010153001 [Paramecium tetraurelia]CAK73881.1 unnamed protein product [Paramecium tetraurelia]|eukprot:XP_001441278.1 hypothetical protein (macronuclear) [Paramecium tetraurelia strain d4-2]